MTTTNGKHEELGVRGLSTRLAALERQLRGAQWWRRAALMLAAAGALAPVAGKALGPVPHVFGPGDTVSAAAMNANFVHLQNGITANESQVPAGAILFFNSANCPGGWSEVTAARGRALVGMPGSAGTLAGTVGSALTDRENRSHNHSVDIGPLTTTAAGAHNHQWLNGGLNSFNSSGSNVPMPPLPFQSGAGAVQPNLGNADDKFTNNAPSHTHGVNPPAAPSTMARTGDVMPYVQYLVCSKN